MGLVCVNNENPSNLSRAKAYLKHYESFDKDIIYLDSAKVFLEKCSIEESLPSYIQYYYLKKEYKRLIEYIESNNIDDYYKSFNINDIAYSYFRIGEAYAKYNFNINS